METDNQNQETSSELKVQSYIQGKWLSKGSETDLISAINENQLLN